MDGLRTVQPDLSGVHAEHELVHWWFTGRRRVFRALVREVLPPGREKLIVDVGCATGGNTAAMGADYAVLGSDVSPAAIALARQEHPQFEFLCGEAPAILGDDAARADLFLLTDVLEHVEDDYRLFSSLAAAAKPGALFLVTVPADPALWSPHDVSLGHYRRYLPETFRRLWAGLPIREIALSHFNSRLFRVVQLMRVLARLRGRSLGHGGTDVRMPPAPLNRLLERILAGEARVICDLARGKRARGYRRGVSLLALLRREPGPLEPRGRPAEEVADGR